MPPRASLSYQRPIPNQFCTASGRTPQTTLLPEAGTFPGPIVLPGDYLDEDPRYPAQSFRSWKRDKERNEITRERSTIYVVPPPEADEEVGFVMGWTRPLGSGQEEEGESGGGDGGKRRLSRKSGNELRTQTKRKRAETSSTATETRHLRMEDVVDYLAAFYYPMTVKLLPESTLTFTSWSDGTKCNSKRNSENPKFIAVNTPTESICIRTRRPPPSFHDSESVSFPRQLNLDDLLDATLSILPSDAYAILSLIQHDLYEDADDDFACGRAYGASRIAVVSMARYDPGLDGIQGLKGVRPWPASHFDENGSQIDTEGNSTVCPPPANKKRKIITSTTPDDTGPRSSHLMPLLSALSHHTATPSPSSLYLLRLCRTASHELGHCFGMDHCVYYACVMQGTSSLREDMRQPMELCPVDLEKVVCATGAGVRERYEKMVGVCKRLAERFGEGGKGKGPWRAFGAWLEGRLRELDKEG